VAPAETTLWVINATLTVFKLESDSDYHLPTTQTPHADYNSKEL
jgi:hypothetical protein